MNDRRTMRGIVGLLIVLTMISPAAAVAVSSAEDPEISLPVEINSVDRNGYYVKSTSDETLWDNGMYYNSLIAAQLDETISFDARPADDFMFDNDTTVTHVNWIGGYWSTNYTQGAFDWEITFYEDRGDGDAPGSEHLGPYVYTQDQCNPELIEDTGISIFYAFSVALPESATFSEGETYWISIIAIGDLYPQSAWAYHSVDITMHQFVFQSDYFGYQDWTNSGDILVYPADTCFQLTYLTDEEKPSVEITKPVKGIYINNKKILPRIFGIPIIIGDITIEVDATDDESGIEKVEFYVNGNLIGEDTAEPYSFNWTRDRIRLIHIFFIKVVAYDNLGNTAFDRIIVRKIL